jgi:hypothetical protein
MVAGLVRLNRQYEAEESILEKDAGTAAEAPTMNRHVVIVLIDALDMAAARAIQYARSLTPDELIAVHFDLDPIRTRDLTEAWPRLGFSRLALDVIDCPDRRLERSCAELVARQLLDGDTEVSVLLPRREYSRFWHRLVHDRTADSIAKTLAMLPHCNTTIVPFHIENLATDLPELVLAEVAAGGEIDAPAKAAKVAKAAKKKAKPPVGIDLSGFELPADRVPIAELSFRQRAKVAGKVYSMRVQPWSGVAALELNLIDDTGALTVVFFGRRHLAGVTAGTRLLIEGVVSEHKGSMAVLNPAYEIQFDPHAAH